jgi:exopolysaccharide biosynthesis predicted pyruvyltransferase EpsI
MEISTEENEKLVSEVYERSMQLLHGGRTLSDVENLVFQVELLSQEVNSGASFEQYFRWVGKTEVDQILELLNQLELSEVSGIVEKAIKIAFPDGVPDTEDEYDNCTEWSESQEEKLESLFEEFEQYNGVITNRLGAYISARNPA